MFRIICITGIINCEGVYGWHIVMIVFGSAVLNGFTELRGLADYSLN